MFDSSFTDLLGTISCKVVRFVFNINQKEKLTVEIINENASAAINSSRLFTAK